MENIYYVYMHFRLSDNKLFYIGKGKNNRAYQRHSRNRHWNFTNNKHSSYALIYADQLTENQALELEKKLIKEYKDQLVNITGGGEGISGYRHTEENKKIFSEINSGPNNYNYDKSIYEFIKDDGSYFKGTQFDFSKKYNFNRSGVSAMCKGRTTSHFGWYLKGTVKIGRSKGKDNYNYNFTKYEFFNKELNILENMTQNDFSKKYKINHSPISALCRGARKSIYGWTCLNVMPQNVLKKETKEKISKSLSGPNNHNYDKTIRIFKHKDGNIEKCTMNELKVKYGLSCHISSVISGRLKHHKGWSYVGPLC